MAEKQTNKDRLKEITDSIEAGIKELFQSEKYTQYLRTMSRFHHYSVNNTMLIHIQKPDATLVAGFNKWKNEFSRNVMRGEKGIKIIAPTPFKKMVEEEKLDPDTKLPMCDADGNIIMEEKEIRIPMYKPVTVFDVSQTEGKPLPTLAADLKGDVRHYEVFMEALRRSSPVPMAFEQLAPNLDGYFSPKEQRIAIREGMSEVQTVSAAVHEITHAKLHNYKEKDAIDNKEQYEQVEIFGQPALFSNKRVDRSKLPEDLFCYDLRGSNDDPGKPSILESFVAVNRAGSIITASEIELPEKGYLDLNDSLNFLSEESSLRAFYEKAHPDKVEKDRRTEEVEAESVSYAVCAYYGIETGENSFGYIASWSKGKELKELRASLETIRATADGLIGDIDRHFKEICKEQGLDLSGEEPCQNEQFYKVNEAQYLHVQRCDDGYDYTFYNAADKATLDGGQLDDPDLSIREAAEKICSMHDVPTDDMSVVACELPEEFTEAASASMPRDRYTELVEHFEKEDAKLWDTKLDEYPLPDDGMTEEDLASLESLEGGLLPVCQGIARSMIFEDMTVYAVTPQGTELLFDSGEVMERPEDAVFAIPKEEWEQSAAFRIAVENRMARQEDREKAFLDHGGNCFAIYQMKLDDPDLAGIRYMGMDYLQKQGVQPNRGQYELAYTGELSEGQDLNTLWERFNIHQPADYMRPSMSVSDIIAIKKDGVVSCHYVDDAGFRELPGFLQPENHLKTAEMQMEDDYNMLDGVINNGPKQPTVAELESQARSGQPISLLDLAEAIRREDRENRQKSAPEKRSSVLAKIRKPLPGREEIKKAPEKSADKELTR